MDQETVAAYLARVGVTRPAACDAAALRGLHGAHQLTVPFENLSLHLGEPISLDERDLGRQDRAPPARRLLLRAQRGVRTAARGARRAGEPGRGPGVRGGRPGPACGTAGRSTGSICSRLTPGGRVSVSGRLLIQTEDGARTEQRLDGDDALLAAYREHFGVVLSRVPDDPSLSLIR
jgi:arylamine N-acetyltransferase